MATITEECRNGCVDRSVTNRSTGRKATEEDGRQQHQRTRTFQGSAVFPRSSSWFRSTHSCRRMKLYGRFVHLDVTSILKPIVELPELAARARCREACAGLQRSSGGGCIVTPSTFAEHLRGGGGWCPPNLCTTREGLLKELTHRGQHTGTVRVSIVMVAYSCKRPRAGHDVRLHLAMGLDGRGSRARPPSARFGWTRSSVAIPAPPHRTRRE